MATKGQENKKKPSPPLPKSPSSPPPNLDGWLEIGTIVAPQGLAGEVRVYPDSDFPERFEVPGKRWILRPGTSTPQPIQLLSGRIVAGKNLYILRLAGVENCNQAEDLRDCKLLVPESDRPKLRKGEYHVLDLIGLEVFLQASGENIGKVVDILSAGHDLLEVKPHLPTAIEGDPVVDPKAKKPKNWLIPFVKAIAPVVDLESGRIEITPPPGLLEIND